MYMTIVQMNESEKMKYKHDLGVFIQNLAFYICGTAAMAAAAIVLLAGQIDRHYADARALEIQKYKNSKLIEIRDQQSELLTNLDNEAIVKRAARITLNYITSEDSEAEEQGSQPERQWQDINYAVLLAADDFPKEQKLPFWGKYARIILNKEQTKNWLLGISAGMLVICLTFFGSKKHC